MFLCLKWACFVPFFQCKYKHTYIHTHTYTYTYLHQGSGAHCLSDLRLRRLTMMRRLSSHGIVTRSTKPWKASTSRPEPSSPTSLANCSLSPSVGLRWSLPHAFLPGRGRVLGQQSSTAVTLSACRILRYTSPGQRLHMPPPPPLAARVLTWCRTCSTVLLACSTPHSKHTRRRVCCGRRSMGRLVLEGTNR